jgi:hypothetical protein
MHTEPKLPQWLETLVVLAQEFQPIAWLSPFLG